MSDDGSPRLPDAVTSHQLELDWTGARPPAVGSVDDAEWPPFEEPDLVSLRGGRSAVLASRAGLVVWAVAVFVAALLVRSSAGEGFDDGTNVTLMGRFGVAATLVAALAGWLWSDRAARNVHALDARLPSRLRCASAWLSPMVWFVLLSITILQIEPSDELDIRPPIIVTAFAVSLWRPYALVRRIVSSISRVGSDPLILSAYVLEVAAFGLLWWQLSSFPAFLTPSNAGTADVLIGVAAASALAFAANVVIWTLLSREIDHAMAHRQMALRTRHDHRQLRLRGIDPMDPEVRYAMLKIYQERAERGAEREAAEREAAEREATDRDAVEAEAEAERAAAAAEREEAAARQAEADLEAELEAAARQAEADLEAELAAAARQAEAELEADLEAELEADLEAELEAERQAAERGADDVTAAAPEVDELSAELAEALGPDAVAETGDAPPVEVVEERIGEVAELDEGRPADVAGRLRERLDDVAPAAEAEPAESATTDELVGRVGSRLGAARGTDDRERRLERLTGRLASSAPDVDAGASLVSRLAELGITSVSHGFEDEPAAAEHGEPDAIERQVLPQIYALEAARYAMLLAMALTSVVSVWIVRRSVAAGGQLTGGLIEASDVDAIDLARRVMVPAVGAALALVPLWCAVASLYARRAGAPITRVGRCVALFVAAVALNVVSFLVDGQDRSTPSLLCLFGILAAAIASTLMIQPVQRWSERRTLMLSIWSGGLVVLVATSWIGRLQRPIEPTDALEALTFGAALQAIVAAIVLVVATLSTGDIEEAIKLSPSMAEPAPTAESRR